LSAEGYVERSHRLPSPQTQGPAAGLTRWFFYPGFTQATGGLIREAGLMAEQARFDAAAWRVAHGLEHRPDERVVSLFCYPQAPIDALLRRLADAPTLLLVTAPVAARVAAPASRSGLRVQTLPYLSQGDYDRLLWASDLNFVRGEDSFVRAQWAGAPFVWQIYPQHDDVHLDKLEAFADRFLAGADPSVSSACRSWLHAWNTGAASLPALPAPGLWRQHCRRWRERLLAQPDLTTQLIGFASEKR
jgi:uncharacterized repeat protein (TIGR03837 family)